MYHIAGRKYEMLIGTRAQVWHGTAYKTAGDLTRDQLMQNKAGRIVSKTKHTTAKKEMRLLKYGYGTRKGKFGYVKVGKSKKMRGGSGLKALSPQSVEESSRLLVGGMHKRGHSASMRRAMRRARSASLARARARALAVRGGASMQQFGVLPMASKAAK